MKADNFKTGDSWKSPKSMSPPITVYFSGILTLQTDYSNNFMVYYILALFIKTS